MPTPRHVDVNPAPPRFLVIGNGYFGTGHDLAEAKANYRRYGGRLSDGYRIYEFPDTIRFRTIDAFGRVGWATADGSDYDPDNPAHQPTVTERPGRER